VPLLYRACWEQNADVSSDAVLSDVLTKGGFDGPALLAQANTPAIKAKLREATAEAKDVGICGVPSYRVFRESGPRQWKNVGGIVWGQDQIDVLEDLVAGWDDAKDTLVAEPSKVDFGAAKTGAKL
jgi:2-hydroxychromene-2-carboxylate isomerase